jgi:hypothetical protein
MPVITTGPNAPSPIGTRFGRQPAHALVKDRFGTIANGSRKMGEGLASFKFAMYGTYLPSPRLFRALPEALGVKVEECWMQEVIDAMRRREQVGSTDCTCPKEVQDQIAANRLAREAKGCSR